MIGGWYDHNVELMMQLFGGIQTLSPVAVQNKHKLMMGPWAHGGFGTAQVGTCTQGQLTYNEACGWSDSIALRFFDYHLRNISNNWETEPAIKYFQMGENTWQTTATWPPTGTTPIKLYFNSNNQLSRDLPTNANDSAIIVYDPRDPSPTVGGSTLRQDLGQGPYDQAPVVEMHNDILTFTSPALSENVVMKGTGRVHLFVKSNRPDTDFSIRLTDVYTDGRSMLLADNIQRMRFRNGFRTTDTASMQPNAIYEIDIDIHDLAITFVAGHKIRIDITSANYPRYNNNLNNGGAMYTAGDTLIATNTVFLSTTKASFVELPLISYPSAIADNFATNGQFILYPNPVAESFSITGLDYTEINLYNLNGAKLLSQKRSESYDLRSLPAGVYFVEIVGDGGVYWRKLVKG